MKSKKVYYHLPGLFEFYDFYKEFLPLFYEHREYFYDWCEIGSIYGAPYDCLWGGGRVGYGDDDERKVFALMRKYNISARLTFSNSLLREEHLADRRCNRLCVMLEEDGSKDVAGQDIVRSDTASKVAANKDAICRHGVIVHSDLLMDYLKNKYPNLYLVSSTTKVITDWDAFVGEVDREDFKYVVPDFRLNKRLEDLALLSQEQKDKVEFLCNECCSFSCGDRKACYENVSRKALGEECEDHICKAPVSQEGYVFSKAMENPGFIGVDDILNKYLPMGFTNFKIEGRSLGSAILLEFVLYYMTKPECQLKVREAIYLDASLDLF